MFFLCPVLLLLFPPETILSGLNQTDYPGEVSATPKCRSRGLSLPEEEFRLHTCALCYHFMHPTSFQPTTRWTKVDGDIMRLKFGNATVLADVSDDDSPLLHSFAHPEAEANWRACCLEADRCCQNMTANNKTTGTTAFYSNAF